MSVLKVESLRAYYQTDMYGVSRNVRAVDGVSLELHKNEVYGIAGESSCGKTTLLRTMFGAIEPPIESGGGQSCLFARRRKR